MVGEWTKVPDRDIANMEDDCAKKGLPVRIRNAEPYREFQNFEDNDRYSLNTKCDEAIDHYIPLYLQILRDERGLLAQHGHQPPEPGAGPGRAARQRRPRVRRQLRGDPVPTQAALGLHLPAIQGGPRPIILAGTQKGFYVNTTYGCWAHFKF